MDTAKIWIAVCLILLGMSKGGLPVGSIALHTLVLIWPQQVSPARAAIGFLLPVLCCMDIVALIFYRKRIVWRNICRLFPGMVLGVVLASVLFLAEGSWLAMSDRALKLTIGSIGIIFVTYRATNKWILKRLTDSSIPGLPKSSLFGFAAGVTSTLAHAGGPVLQMYLLPQKLPKLSFAGTTVAFFFVLNLTKVLPYSLQGMITKESLALGAIMLPVVPVGVGLGYLAVRLMKPKYYVGLIYAVLAATSMLLIVKACIPE
jgi:uncharacterized membrane protein YfcA